MTLVKFLIVYNIEFLFFQVSYSPMTSIKLASELERIASLKVRLLVSHVR